MKSKLLGVAAIVFAIPAFGAATVITFEEPVEGPLAPDFYNSVGARIEGVYTFHVPNLSWASARSGLQGICPIATNSADGSSWSSIVAAHGITVSTAGGGTSDVTFFLPGTTTPGVIDGFGIGYGYDSDGGEAHQAVIIEAFNAAGVRVLDIVRPNLYYDDFETFSAVGAVRLRLTQNGYVGFDDLTFDAPVPEPASLVAMSTGAMWLLGRRRNRSSRSR